MTSLYKTFEKIDRQVQFERLVDAWKISKRRKLWISMALFSERLQAMGACLDHEGNWRIDYANRSGK